MTNLETTPELMALARIPVTTVPPSITTPAVLVDRGILRANIRRMAGLASDAGIALRPHLKTHKSVAIARMQLEAGAIGFTVGTLKEAEVLASAGIDDVFLAVTLIASSDRIDRLIALHNQITFRVGIDSVEGAALLTDVAARSGKPFEVLVEVNSGEDRTGVRPSEAGPLAARATELGLIVAGVFTHGGHGYDSRGARSSAGDDEITILEEAVVSMTEAGVPPRIVSAGSTPTFAFSSRSPVTEQRPGTYALNDAGQVALGSCEAEDVAIRIATTVISTAVKGQYVIDAGTKAIAREPAPYLPGLAWMPDWPDSVVRTVNDYHGYVTQGAAGSPTIGDRLAIVPAHVCPVINLFDELHIVENGELVDIWPVDARGH